ncbi:MAG TPA: hypothetical protein VFX28_02470, partial [Methylomirabilota bacterium]|nr:hypothetical protein [Methylomirabilota bacterium]
RVGRLVFWSPGVLITDRQLLRVGDLAVVGMGARIGAHTMLRGSDGRIELLLAPVVIGERAQVGGYSSLGPGACVEAGETLPPTLVLHPFSTWRRGRRQRNTAPVDVEPSTAGRWPPAARDDSP